MGSNCCKEQGDPSPSSKRQERGSPDPREPLLGNKTQPKQKEQAKGKEQFNPSYKPPEERTSTRKSKSKIQATAPDAPEQQSKKLEDKDWYCGKISDSEAEMKLRGRAPESYSYLVYDDPAHDGGYILLVYISQDLIVKRKIWKNERQLYSLEGGKKECVSVKELIKAHRGVTGSKIEYEGESFSLRKAKTSKNAAATDKDPGDKQWYHGKITPDEADARLNAGAQGIDGSYLVYDHQREPGNYMLLVYFKGKLYRWKISKTPDNKYILGEDKGDTTKYDSVKELVKAHRGMTGTPIRLAETEQLVTLSKSYVIRPPSASNAE